MEYPGHVTFWFKEKACDLETVAIPGAIGKKTVPFVHFRYAVLEPMQLESCDRLSCPSRVPPSNIKLACLPGIASVLRYPLRLEPCISGHNFKPLLSIMSLVKIYIYPSTAPQSYVIYHVTIGLSACFLYFVCTSLIEAE